MRLTVWQPVRRMKPNRVSIAEWMQTARRLLSSAAVERTIQEAALESQVLLSHSTGKPRTWLLSHPEAELTDEQVQELNKGLAQLMEGLPLPYLTGQQAFYGLDFQVSPAVLIPRPETELLVEQALDWLRQHPARRSAVDVGTGSGCIAISLADQIANLQVVAVDPSWEALQVARQNVQNLKVAGRVNLVQADLLSALAGPFDLFCANLPYIPAETLSALAVTKHEPRLALDGGPEGLQAITQLLEDLARRQSAIMAAGSLLLLEIEAGQSKAAVQLGVQHFPNAHIEVLPDLAGLPRLLRIENQAKEG